MRAPGPAFRASLTDVVTISESSNALLRSGRAPIPKILFNSGHFKFEENLNLVRVEFSPKYRIIANGGVKRVC
jgi:hypothetical protein